MRSPDDHAFETLTLWGCISQFDTGTGEDTFRAQASYRKERYWYSDGENSLFTTFAADELRDFFTDDQFRAQVTIFGSYTYDTTLGGQLTVPWFVIDEIELLRGSC